MTKLSAIDTQATIAGNERIPVVDDPTGTPATAYVEVDDIVAYVSTSLSASTATITGTTDTLDANDDNMVNLYTAAGAVTVTLANLTVEHETVLVCLGAGGLSVAAGGMSFANAFTPQLTVAQGESLYVRQTAASTWIVIGGTAT